eukprot:20975-Eustigmatos_ZCMA.PRE.1
MGVGLSSGRGVGGWKVGDAGVYGPADGVGGASAFPVGRWPHVVNMSIRDSITTAATDPRKSGESNREQKQEEVARL